MQTVSVRVGNAQLPAAAGDIGPVIELPTRPKRKDIDPLISFIRAHRPDDLGPTLAQLQAQPDIAPLGDPQGWDFAGERVRVIIAATDADAGCVITRLLRTDYLWVDVGFIPQDSASLTALRYGIPRTIDAAWELATTLPSQPVPLIRDDAARVVLGWAVIHTPDQSRFIGEIIVDDEIIVHDMGAGHHRLPGFGAKLCPTIHAPGIEAIPLTQPCSPPDWEVGSSSYKRPWWSRLGRKHTPTPATPQIGRAVQAGGVAMTVCIDGVDYPKPIPRITFYRHLRDLMLIRP